MNTKPTGKQKQVENRDLLPEKQRKLKRIDIEKLKRVTEKMPFQTESAGDFIRRLRDTDRY